MSNDTILSLDLGTSFIKGFLVDKNLSIIQEEAIEIETLYNNQFHEQDPYSILSAVQHLIRENEGEVHSMIFTNAMHSLLLLDLEMEPLTNSIIWSDMRASETYNEFCDHIDPMAFYELTKVPLHPILPSMKLFWFWKKNNPLFKQATYIASLKDWILFKLTGEFVTDVSTAASTGLMNFNKNEWDNTLLSICNVSLKQLPGIKFGSHKISLKNSSIIIGNTDGPMANYLVNTTHAFSENLVVTAGTSAAVRILNISSPTTDPLSGIFTYQINEKVFVSGIASNNAGSVLKWSVDNLDLEYLSEPIVALPEINDPIFNPFIYEERAPLWNENNSITEGNYSDIQKTGKINLIVYEAIFFNILRMLDSLERMTKSKDVIISGGVFKNNSIVQLFSNITQKKVIVLDTSQLSALGSAKFGLELIGFTFDNLNLNYRMVYPDEKWKEIESKRYTRFKELLE